jgi:hypothetical protein
MSATKLPRKSESEDTRIPFTVGSGWMRANKKLFRSTSPVTGHLTRGLGGESTLSSKLPQMMVRVEVRVVNYPQWRSQQDFEAMRDNPEAQAHMKPLMELSKPDFHLYEVVDTFES